MAGFGPPAVGSADEAPLVPTAVEFGSSCCGHVLQALAWCGWKVPEPREDGGAQFSAATAVLTAAAFGAGRQMKWRRIGVAADGSVAQPAEVEESYLGAAIEGGCALAALQADRAWADQLCFGSVTAWL